MNLLKKLYLTHSPSKREENLSKLVVEELKKIGIKDFEVDELYQIYRLKENTPLLCAHLDQVSFQRYATTVNLSDGIIYGNGNLGADDKNGVWILLKLLREFKDISFIFSTQEEVGCKVSKIMERKKEIFKTIKYGLVFDRRGHSDLVGTFNDYCVDKFEDDLRLLMLKHGFNSEIGTFSDCDRLSEMISCINISCGYYEAHTAREFTILQDLFKSLRFGRDILKNITDWYNAPEKERRRGHWWWGDDDWKARNYIDHTHYSKGAYQCSGCNEYYDEKDDEYLIMDINEVKRCQICWAPLMYILYEDEYDMVYEEDEFHVGDKVVILDKKYGMKLENTNVPWNKWDEAFVAESSDDCIFLSKIRGGGKEAGMFCEEDLQKVEEDTDPLCYICKKFELEITLDAYDSGCIYICPDCNFTFPVKGSCGDIRELKNEYTRFTTLHY